MSYIALVTDVALIALDYLRISVLSQMAFVLVLVVIAFVKTYRRYITHTDSVRILIRLRLGRLLALFGIFVFVLSDAIVLLQRLGQPKLNWQTPVAQVALIAFFISWSLIDRGKVDVLEEERFKDA